MAVVIPTRDDVERAASLIRGRVRRTPVLDACALGHGVMVKAELFQHAGSFKVRGVTNRLSTLTQDERARGVIGVSAGNHAMALAWGAANDQIDCVVVMFAGASTYKLEQTRALGATVEMVDGDPAAAFTRMNEIVEQTGRIPIHPFDDPLVVAGQGTVGLEILEDVPDVDTIIVPTGGGGLVSGIATAVSSSGVKVVAVEPEGSAALHLGLAAGRSVPLSPVTRAGGLDAPFAGSIAVECCRQYGVTTVLVSEDAIEEAMRRVYSDLKLACEPAAAAGVAALASGVLTFGRAVVVVSGGNVSAEVASAILASR